MKLFILIFLLSISAVFAQGRDRVGNGGDVVVCPGSVLLLDSIEMKDHGLKLSLPGAIIRQKVLRVVGNIIRLDVNRGINIRMKALELIQGVEDFEVVHHSENVDFTNRILMDVPDSFETTIPKNCHKEQLVTHKVPIFASDREFTIAKRYWSKLNLNQKALTVLHEAWSIIFLEEGARDSRFARYMNGVFATEDAHEMSSDQYLKHLSVSEVIGSFSNGRRRIIRIIE